MAFAVAEYRPDRVDETQVKELTKKLFGDSPSLAIQARAQRLALQANVGARGQAKEASRRLSRVLIEGELAPSHALVDKAASMLQDGVARYIPPSACVAATGKKDLDILRLEGGALSVRRKDPPTIRDLNSAFCKAVSPAPVSPPRTFRRSRTKS